jgi:hypothetical protein
MPALGPVSSRTLVRVLLNAGFDGPHPGAKHQIMRCVFSAARAGR